MAGVYVCVDNCFFLLNSGENFTEEDTDSFNVRGLLLNTRRKGCFWGVCLR